MRLLPKSVFGWIWIFIFVFSQFVTNPNEFLERLDFGDFFNQKLKY